MYSPTRQTHTEFFDKAFPYYLFLGMSAEQFWEESPYLAIAYRKAYDMKRTARNQELWLQGLYNYRAFGAVMEEFAYGMNGRKGAKPKGYIKEPIPITEYEKEQERERKIRYTLEWVKKGQTKRK